MIQFASISLKVYHQSYRGQTSIPLRKTTIESIYIGFETYYLKEKR